MWYEIESNMLDIVEETISLAQIEIRTLHNSQPSSIHTEVT